MKIIVIGLGSMGKRRIRLLSEKKDIQLLGVDSQESRCAEVKEKFGLKCYASIAEAVAAELPDAAVISTSPLSHAAIIKECLQNDLHVFTELNLVSDGYLENMALAKEKGKVLFLSSTFLYRKELQTIIEKTNKAVCPLNYMYHVGQYLPDWHPWESYNNYFIGNPRTNGCRELLAIELPWIVTAFGPIKSISAIKSKNTGLNINYNDNYLITIEHENGNKGMMAVDVVTPKATRYIDVFGENFHMSWNGSADSLKEFDAKKKTVETIILDDASEHMEGYAAFITENPYREELNAYLAQIANINAVPAWTFEKDYEVLKIIDKIEA
jgi:predicted dehydrogenase